MKRDELIQRKLDDLQTTAEWIMESVASIRSILAEPAREYESVTPGDGSRKRQYKAKRRVIKRNVTACRKGAVAESQRRAIANEAQLVLSSLPEGQTLTSSRLAELCPTVALRYTTPEKQVSGLGSILATMGDKFHIRNVSPNSNRRWTYVGPRE